MDFTLIISLLSMSLGAALSAPIWLWLAKPRQGVRAPETPLADQPENPDPWTLIQREPRTLFIWPTPEDEEPRTLAHGVADHPASWAAFKASVAAPHWEKFERKVDAFRAGGTPFHLPLVLKDDTYEAESWTVNDEAFLSLRRACSSVTQQEHAEEMLERAPLPAWRRDGQGRLVWANAAYARAVDLRNNVEAVRQQASLICPDADEAGDAPVRRRHAIIAGERRLLDIMEYEIAEGRAGFAIDVTPIEVAQDARARVISGFRSVLDRVSTALAIFDARQRLVFHNRPFDELWGLDTDFLREDISEGEWLDRLRTLRLIPEQPDYRRWRARRLQAYQEPTPSEELWHLPDGRTLIAYTQAHPIGGVIRLYENVTEQLSLERSLRTQARVQQESLDNLYEAVAVFGADGRLKLFNPAYASLWGFDPAELKTEPHMSAIIERTRALMPYPERADRFIPELAEIHARRAPVSSHVHRRDGRILSYSVVPLPDGATLITSLDITDTARMAETLRERNEALAAADRLKTDFIGHVSHQLRTPLTRILASAETLAENGDVPLDAQQRDNIADILSASQDLMSMVDDMIDLAMLDAGALRFARLPVDLGALCDDLVKRLAATAKAKNIHLDTAREGVSPVTIASDAGRLRQVLMQLVNNAMESSRPGDGVTIRLHPRAASVTVSIEDSGIGMPSGEQAFAFGRFETHAETGKHRRPGLGLALVRGLVDGLGGFVAMKSVPDQGTRVVCHLPRELPDTLKRQT